MSPNKEIDRLAKYLMENFPNEIGEGDHVHGGSAVDVAIRLLDKYKIGLSGVLPRCFLIFLIIY